MGEVIAFPVQPEIKRELTEELLWEEAEIRIKLNRANELRRKLGLPVRQMVTLAASSGATLYELVPGQDDPAEDSTQ